MDKNLYPLSLITADEINAIKLKSVDALPNSPAAYGMKAGAVKPKFWHPLVQGDDSIVGYVNRLIEELNKLLAAAATNITYDEQTHELKIVFFNGEETSVSKNIQGLKGDMGPKPKKGVDYWTEADKQEIKAYVEEAILGGAW